MITKKINRAPFFCCLKKEKEGDEKAGVGLERIGERLVIGAKNKSCNC
jgi:hypothetical protein